MPQVHICRGFGDKDWKALTERLIKANGSQANEQDWQRAVDIFDRRIRERFLLSIEALENIKTEKVRPLDDEANEDRILPKEILITPGFAIMALCCLLIDTLQFFRAGKPPRIPHQRCPTPATCSAAAPSTRQAFVKFLTECLRFGEKEAKSFTDGIRNGILHQAETRGWVIKLDEPENAVVSCEGPPYILNRTIFCAKLRAWYKDYVTRLSNPNDPEQIELRKHFAASMKHVVDECRKRP